MKFQLALALTGAAAVVSAQSACNATAAIPTCGIPCITSAASAVGCAPTDYACQCSASASSAIEVSALSCVLGACGLVTASQVQSAAEAICTACA